MAQDPERQGGRPGDAAADMVTLFSSSAIDAEMEADTIHAVLEANGIASMVVGPSVIPSLEYQVRVAREDGPEAERLIEEARAAGPDAADEAEAGSEEPGPDK